MLGFSKDVEYRSAATQLPEKPVALPYDLRTEMTWLDFCNPVNPLGTPKPFVQAMHTALVDGELNYTPDRDGRAFCTAMSSLLRVSADCVLLGSSATNMITMAARAFQCGIVGIVSPCSPEYVNAICNAGHTYTELTNSVSFATVDAYTARAEFGDFDGALLGNPTFPTSRLLSRQVLVHYLETCKFVIVDESNIELSFGGESMVPLVERYRNLIVVRNPSTTFSMPGTPISYMVAHPETIARIRQFNDGGEVSMFAEVLTDAIKASQEYLDQTHEFLDKEIPWMQCMLSLIPGIDIYPAEGNFVLCEFNAADGMRLGVSCAEELIVRLQLTGLLVRRVSGVAGLDGDGYFCVCVRKREENERLLAAMRKIINTIN